MRRRTITFFALGALLIAFLLWWRGTSNSPPEPPREPSPAIEESSGLAPSPMPSPRPSNLATPEEPTVQYRVIDMGTSKPVPALEFRAQGEGLRRTDADGRVVFPVAWTRSGNVPEVVGSVWRLMDTSKYPIEGNTLLVARFLHIHGRVVVDGPPNRPFDANTLEIWASTFGPDGLMLNSPERDSGPAAYAENKVKNAKADLALSSLSFQVLFPCSAGVKLVATAPSWRSDDVVVYPPKDPQQDTVEVEVRLRPAPRIKFEVVDENGQPIQGAAIRLQFCRRVPWDTNPGQLKPGAPGWGYGFAGPVDGSLIVSGYTAALTDSKGVFAADTTSEGLYYAVITHEGAPPLLIDLGVPRVDHNQKIEIRRAPHPESRIALRDGGVPIAKVLVRIVDTTDIYFQFPVQSVATDDKGRIPAYWLEEGRDYFFLIGKQISIFHYSGQTDLDVAKLPHDITTFLKGR